MTKKILTINNLSISYGQNVVVKNFHLEILEGQVVGIIGLSGCGKSSIASSILKLSSPRAKITGSIEFDQQNLLGLSEKELRKIRGAKIAMIFQDPLSSLNPLMKIGKQITEVITLHLRLSKQEAKKRALFWLKEVGLNPVNDRYHQYPHELSGGMRQRVMIAMALSTYPKLLIADEPTSALDVTIQKQILTLLKDLQKKYKMSILFISHHFGVINYLCDQVVVIHEKKVVEKGLAKELFQSPKEAITKFLLHQKNPLKK